MNRAIFLDRDGVINRTLIRDGRAYAPATVADFVFLPGVPEAIERLRQAGFRLIVTTNQPDVANGKVTREIVESMHAILRKTLQVDAIKVCYHVDADACDCRKPKPGMLLEAAREWNIDLSTSFMVGDRWRDVEAGIAAGCKTVLVGKGYEGEKFVEPDVSVDSLLSASKWIVAN